MVSVVYILAGNLKNSYYFKREEYEEGETIKMKLAEEVSFLNKVALRKTLDYPPASVVIDDTNIWYIDFDIIEIIKEFKEGRAPLKNLSAYC